MTGSLPELIADWWFAIALFVFLPFAVFLKASELIANRFGSRTRSTADFEVERMTRTREEGDRSAYTQTKRSERRHHLG